MWVVVLVLLVIIALLMLRVVDLRGQLEYAKRAAMREALLRSATEVAFCEVVEEQIGDRLRGNMRRVSETATRFDKARSNGQPN